MSTTIRNVKQVVALWDSPQTFADDCQVRYNTAMQWQLRNSIPSHAWLSVLRGAKARGYKINCETLVKLHAARK